MPDPTWDIDSLTQPWDNDRSSIHRHIEAHLNPDGPGLLPGGEELPDEAARRVKHGLAWAAGAEDGVWGHHLGSGGQKTAAIRIFNALTALALRPTTGNARALYKCLTTTNTLAYIDQLLALIRQRWLPAPQRLRAIARWLATEAPDREAVKTGLALLGLFTNGQDRELLLTMGRHEEFTLYAAVALANTGEEPELFLWELARHVTGWGRIQIIERLTETTNGEIKAWLLREGCRNAIMNEYTALICAKTGDLLGALKDPEPDAALLAGAGVILGALIPGGGPAEGIQSYPDGAEATEFFLGHLARREAGVADFLVVQAIKRFILEDDTAKDPNLGWPERREAILALAEAILSRPDWTDKIMRDLNDRDNGVFGPATTAAHLIGLDIWEIYFKRTAGGESHWYFLMQTDDAERIDRVLRLAAERIPLAEIATGARDEIGLGRQFGPHGELDFVLQGLARFPGRGWPFIEAGLRSPVTRNRNTALRALAEWGRPRWPAAAMNALANAARREPVAETKRNMRRVLRGLPLAEPRFDGKRGRKR